ncbi:tetratricopeptide repeat protein [Undibacterium sp. Di27W]|uniref:tetratricopeptide repeat protein n=1 Tax=Undibacterium sp. Di27W TaxID=3413036 RepID=UPI003BF2080F
MLNYLGSILKCTGCDQQFNFDAANCYGYYSNHSSNLTTFSDINNPLDDVTGLRHYCEVDSIPLLMSPCWCLHCNTATFIERLPDIEQYMKASALRRLPPKKARNHHIYDSLLELEDTTFALHYQWRLQRITAPKCLRCGNSAYIAIDENKKDTGITHEECWNSPIECVSSPWFSMGHIRTSCYYALDGKLNWLHLDGSAVISCMTDHPCQADLREAAYAIIRKDTAPALDVLQSLAREGISAAITGLGGLYQTGMGVEPDGKLALHYLSKGLAAGDGIAAVNLAGLYRFGATGVDKNEEISWSYARIARKMGIFLY